MKKLQLLTAAAIATTAIPATAQQAAGDYRICPSQQITDGQKAVRTKCGELLVPNFTDRTLSSESDRISAEQAREAFRAEVSRYSACVEGVIQSYRRPGADASSTVPDEAACAHSWAQDELAQAIRGYGKICVNYSNRSMTDRNITPWSGECYPPREDQTGQKFAGGQQ